MKCPYCEAMMIDITDGEDIDRTERLVLTCLECGYTQKVTREGVRTVLKPTPSLLREKGKKLLKKAEEVERGREEE